MTSARTCSGGSTGWRRRSTPGSGLGSSLVKAIAELHAPGGELAVHAPGLRVAGGVPRAGDERVQRLRRCTKYTGTVRRSYVTLNGSGDGDGSTSNAGGASATQRAWVTTEAWAAAE